MVNRRYIISYSHGWRIYAVVPYHQIFDPVGQLVASLTVDQGVASSISAWSSTLVEIDHEIMSMVIDSGRVVVSYRQKHVHKVLVNCLIKLA